MAEAGAAAGAALDAFAEFLGDLQGRATGGFAIGESRYSRLLRDKELLPFDTPALRERGRAEYERLSEELDELAQRVGGVDDDWPTVLRALNRDHPPSPEAMRRTYADWTERARGFLRARGLVTLPEGEECRVVPSPPLPAPRAGSGLLFESPRLLTFPSRPLLRPVPARRRVARERPPATREQQPRQHPDDRRPRGVPGPSLAPGHGEIAPESRSAGRSAPRTSARAGRSTPST